MALSFKLKLLLAMMFLVLGVIIVTLLLTQRQLETAQDALIQSEFARQVEAFRLRQELRLGTIKELCLTTTKSVRLIGALSSYADHPDEESAEILYQTSIQQLTIPGSSAASLKTASFFCILNKTGKIIPSPAPPDSGAAKAFRPEFEKKIQEAGSKLQRGEQQQFGYLVVSGSGANREVHELIVTKIRDEEGGEVLGAFVLAFSIDEANWTTSGRGDQARSALWTNGELFFHGFPNEIAAELKAEVTALLNKSQTQQSSLINIDRVPTQLFLRPLNPGSHFFPGYQVMTYSLALALEQQKQLRANLIGFGAAAVLVALLFSLAFSQGLTGPIGELVAASQEVEKGNFHTQVKVRKRDEIGRLAASFNQMTQGLLLKEKYRSVLDMVADKQIAEELMSGRIELGGEERFISVLFCDIRGFTNLTQNMAPKDVIEMLNEHFTPMTRIVYAHGGVVDKFVGDLIMAIFGAPKTSPDDAKNACLSALEMLEYREKLNQETGRVIRMGIGIATGHAVAGRMGSKDRLNYTVLGAKVNLASRLCSKAGPGDVVIDEETLTNIKSMEAQTELLGELTLKGFTDPVRAFKLCSLTPREKS